jgi:excisionase family DNA binding protein
MPSRPLPFTAELVSPAQAIAFVRARETTAIPKFFTIAQVAELLEVSTRTVRRWIDTGVLVTHRFGGVVRVAEHDLRAFLAQHRAGRVSDAT